MTSDSPESPPEGQTVVSAATSATENGVRAEELHHLLPGNDLQPTLEPTAPIEEANAEADSQAATNDGTTPEGRLRQFLINVGKLPLMPATTVVINACGCSCLLRYGTRSIGSRSVSVLSPTEVICLL